jgi:hypothetical protein
MIQTVEAPGHSGLLDSAFAHSLPTAPHRPGLRRMASQQAKRPPDKSLPATKSSECSHAGPCDKVDFVSCQDYPRTLEVADFGRLNGLRYSCGWRLESISSDAVIRYRYELFDIHMVYQLTAVRLDHPQGIREQRDCAEFDVAGLQLAGTYTVDVMMPASTREARRHIYETVRQEARVWDDILHLCGQLVAGFHSDRLKGYLKAHRGLVVDDFVHYLKDQKAAK